MSNRRAILCGGVSDENLSFGETRPLSLNLWGSTKNVDLRIEDIRRYMLKDIPPVFVDLIEIATYVYCADQAITRGRDTPDKLGEKWRRELFFRIPVRKPKVWNSRKLNGLLSSTLSFLSEDEYHFEFTELTESPPLGNNISMVCRKALNRKIRRKSSSFPVGLIPLGVLFSNPYWMGKKLCWCIISPRMPWRHVAKT